MSPTNPSEPVWLTRNVEAIQIPAGTAVTLEKGAQVLITQSLGGSYTVAVTDLAGLFRIAGKDGDALGQAVAAGPVAGAKADGSADEEAIWSQLKTCFDPEIPVNIVDLGLIYSLALEPHPAGGSKVGVKMTLTAQGCGMGPAIAADAQQKILEVPGVKEAEVAIVWDPPWGPDRITAAGRERLGMV